MIKFLENFVIFSPFKHALRTLCGLADPKDLATTSWIPRTSQTDLIGPPAIMPVPAGAVLRNTFPEPFFPFTS